MSLSLGDTFNGQYKITKFIGNGSFGQFYTASKITTKQQVTMKIQSVTDNNAKKLTKEIEISKDVNGARNVISYIDSFKHGEFLCLVTEHLPHDLQSQINNKVICRKNVLKLGHEMVQALTHLFHRGVYHTFITASKIRFDDGFTRAVLTDFSDAFMQFNNLRVDLSKEGIQTNMHPDACCGHPYQFMFDATSVLYILLSMRHRKKLYCDPTREGMMQKKKLIFEKPYETLGKEKFLVHFVKQIKRQRAFDHHTEFDQLLDSVTKGVCSFDADRPYQLINNGGCQFLK